jgi:hypothetical protein
VDGDLNQKNCTEQASMYVFAARYLMFNRDEMQEVTHVLTQLLRLPCPDNMLRDVHPSIYITKYLGMLAVEAVPPTQRWKSWQL